MQAASPLPFQRVHRSYPQQRHTAPAGGVVYARAGLQPQGGATNSLPASSLALWLTSIATRPFFRLPRDTYTHRTKETPARRARRLSRCRPSGSRHPCRRRRWYLLSDVHTSGHLAASRRPGRRNGGQPVHVDYRHARDHAACRDAAGHGRKPDHPVATLPHFRLAVGAAAAAAPN